jgi:DNA-directed RNA polymerase subunit E'/Rpb7
MIETIIIEKKICLNSKYLNSNIYKHLLDTLINITSETCTQDFGYILKINRIVDILNHTIGRTNNDNIFNIKFEADIFKPQKNMKVSGIVCMIYKDGIFINIINKQKILIPTSNLKEYDFIEKSNIYQHKNTKNIITIGDNIECIINAVGYINKSYSCFGEIN